MHQRDAGFDASSLESKTGSAPLNYAPVLLQFFQPELSMLRSFRWQATTEGYPDGIAVTPQVVGTQQLSVALAATAVFFCSLLVFPTLAATHVRHLAADAIQGIGTCLSGYASHLLMPEAVHDALYPHHRPHRALLRVKFDPESPGGIQAEEHQFESPFKFASHGKEEVGIDGGPKPPRQQAAVDKLESPFASVSRGNGVSVERSGSGPRPWSFSAQSDAVVSAAAAAADQSNAANSRHAAGGEVETQSDAANAELETQQNIAKRDGETQRDRAAGSASLDDVDVAVPSAAQRASDGVTFEVQHSEMDEKAFLDMLRQVCISAFQHCSEVLGRLNMWPIISRHSSPNS